MPDIIWPSERFADRLTRRERQVFDLLVIGKSNAETAAELGVATGTVEVFRLRLMRKLEARNFAALLWLGLLGVLPPETSTSRSIEAVEDAPRPEYRRPYS